METMRTTRIAGLLAMTGFEREHFNGLKRDQNTPFYVAKSDKMAGWAEYTIGDAFELRLLGELIGKNSPFKSAGLLAGFACQIVRNALVAAELVHQRSDPWFFASAASPMFLGCGEFKDEATDGTISNRAAWFCGPIEDLPSWIAKEAGGAVSTLNRVVMVNATEAAQHVLKKAAALGLIDQGRATE